MTAPPMRPVENTLAIVAAFLVAGALLPWRLRVACALAAIGIAIFLAVLRWRAHGVRVQKRRTTNVYGAVARIRADRKARFDKTRRSRRED